METDPTEDYARGSVPFLGATIFLDSRPLIPRAETEYWVEKAVAAIGTSPARVLDLFAGSGCIGIAVLKHAPQARVDFGEIEERHFPTVQKSIRENTIDISRTRFFKTDVFSAIPDRYDRILANPPYIAPGSTGVERSVTDHEPHQALFAEEEGFALIRKTIEGAAEHLTERGELWIEHDPEQGARILETAKNHGLSGIVYADQYGVLRYTVLHAG